MKNDRTPGSYVRAAVRARRTKLDKQELVECDERDAEMHTINRLYRVNADTVVSEKITTVKSSVAADRIVEELNELAARVRAAVELEA